jgi:esterase/lipase
MVTMQEEENRSEKSKSNGPPVSNDEISNLASALFKDQNLDLGKVVNMASNLATNENLMKSVIDFAKLKSSQQEPQENAQNANSSQGELSRQMEQVATELAKFRQELETLKEQTEQIRDTVMLINERTNKKFLGLF